ncbi:MAG: single-stranded DNA-binding protein [Magnetococcales bacterium]|nr:single-stranded DNA-binding protein [Magnetococcales bacterium]
MAFSLNKVQLIGNLGQDPEIRYTQDGRPIASLNIATSESWMDKNSGQRQERTEWHRVSIFGKPAEIAQQYLRKGSKVFIEGSLHTEKWTDKQGQDRYTTKIKVAGFNSQMIILDPRGGAGAGAPNQQGGDYQQGGGYQQNAAAPQPGYGAPAAAPAAQAAPPQNNQTPAAAPDAMPDFDDDIPF